MLCDLIAPASHGGEPVEVGALLGATRARSERVASVAERLLQAAFSARDRRAEGASHVMLRALTEVSPRIDRMHVAGLLAARAQRVLAGAEGAAMPTRTPLLIA